MKVLKIINACFICAFFIPFVLIFLVILFPICTIGEIITLIQEYFTEDAWDHNWFSSFVADAIEFIKDIYKKMTK